MSDFKVIETQEELDGIIKDRLDRERKAVRKEYEGYDDIKTENETLKKKLADYDGKKVVDPEEWDKKNSELAKYETNSVKMRIAKEFNLPDELALRLTGDDEEALKKDAELLSNVASQTGSVQTLPLGETNTGDEAQGDAAILKQVRELRGE